MGKKCSCCKRKWPLFMYSQAVRFTIPTDLGKNRCCRFCVWKGSKGPVVRWRDGKFKIVTLSLRERITEFFKV